ncbi:MAG: leucine-rich repeat domain-containing protein, partial [Pseudomonadota bacterium]
MLKSQIYISLLLFVLMSPLAQAATDCAAVTEIPSTECEALVALYESTDGANWKKNRGWNVTDMPCSWYGVSCGGEHVSKLYLYNNQLTGSIPTELSNLSNLTGLSLYNNQLTGSIPTELGNLSNLESLFLGGNQLTGSIPRELGNLTYLEDLGLSSNELTGSIPTELGNTSLNILDLSSNKLTGTIPSELGNLTGLGWFFLSDNQLTGPIPSELGKLLGLGELGLDNNSLCGEIPVELKNLSNIYKLKLDNNHLTAYDEELIAWLDSHNPGWDTTQTSCSGFFNTPIVRVAENDGTATLTVQRNGDTSGALEIDYATTDVSAVQGHDYIGATGTLYWADGDSTDKSFTITIIDDSNSETNETFIVTLSLPISGESLDNATVVIKDNDPVDCAAVTEIPYVECEALVALYNSTGGANWWNNAGWNVTNTPCSWYGVSCSGGHVSELNLDYNQLTGSIPSELGNLSNLRELRLSQNQLTGSIPSELGNLSNLRELRLSHNQLTGSIPSELGNLSNLRELRLSYNQLTGSIPSELGNLTELKRLSLYNNQLTGSIPS